MYWGEVCFAVFCKLAGFGFREAPAGPSPMACAPWQAEQLVSYKVFPAVTASWFPSKGLVALAKSAGGCWRTGVLPPPPPPPPQAASSSDPMIITPNMNQTVFLIDFLLSVLS